MRRMDEHLQIEIYTQGRTWALGIKNPTIYNSFVKYNYSFFDN